MFPSKSILFIVLLLTLSLQSCFKDLFEPLPESIHLKPTIALPIAKAQLNIDNSLLLLGYPSINLDELVPYWAQYETLHFIDTITFSINNISYEVEQIKFIEFNFLIWNEFPSTAQVQVLFIDDFGDDLHSLFSPNPLTLSAGQIDNSGEVLQPGYSFTSTQISDERISTITSATRIVLIASVTNVGIPINLFEYYYYYQVNIKLSARIGLILEL